jgi:nucleotide-binding universal stress UspA family protein
MVPITRLLCPIDFSDPSRHALEHGVLLAQWYDAAIVGVHVFNPTYAAAGAIDVPADGGTMFANPARSRRLQQEMADAFAAARTAGVPVETCIEEGTPAPQILSGVARHRADLIVMGTHGASGFERLVLGSVTEKVVRKAACPVLTVPPRAHSMSHLPFRRILCPIDFSPPSAEALRLALSLAQEAEAQLMLLHVLEWPIGHEPPPLPAFNVPEYRIYREQEAAAELATLVPAAARAWCEPSTHLVHGKPHEQVLGFAGDHGVDLIVIGVHGRNALDVALFGSTTNQVIRGANCPVLTLRPVTRQR